MIKKISAILLALTISVSAFASCSNSSTKSSSKASSTAASTTDSAEPTAVSAASLTIDGEKIDTKDLIMCTIDGVDIDFDTFRYYYFYTLNIYANNYGASPETIAQTDGGFEMLLEDVITQLKQEYVSVYLANENDITLTDEDYTDIEGMLAQSKENFETEEAFQQALVESYMTPALFDKMVEMAQIYTKVEETLLTNGGKYATSEEDFKKIVQDNDKYSRVIHVLIPYESQAEITNEDTLAAYDDYTLSEKSTAKTIAYNNLSEDEQATAKDAAKAKADEILAKAQSGEDFEKLVTDYGWDPGMVSSPEGYYITPTTSFVQEFVEAAFSLKENEISELVESTDYGWFIIKRLPVDMDYVEENISSMIIEYDSPSIKQLYSDIMEKMTVTYGEYFDKLTIESIT